MHKWKNKSHGDCSTVTGTIGVAGGQLATPDGLVIEIPSGALDTDTTLTVSATDAEPPSGIGAVSPVYEFEPDGLVFATPVKVTLPLPTNVSAASVYWSRLGGTEFDAIGGTIEDGTITAETVHFSLAVIGSPAETRTVTGVARDTWISATSRRSLPSDVQGNVLEALVSDGMGGLVSVPGTYAPDGTFTIPGVPVGEYILRARSSASGELMIVTASNAPDLGRKLGGKPLSERTPLTTSTILDLTVAGLEPWERGDSVELFSTQVDNWLFDLDLGQEPQVGASTAALPVNMRFAHNTFTPAAIDGAVGDVVTIAQLTQQTSSMGASYRAMARLGSLPSTFSLGDGANVAATVTLSPISATETLAVNFRGQEFVTALNAYGHPSARTCLLCGGFVGALAQAGLAADGFYTANADLMLMDDTADTGTNIVSGPLAYPDVSSLDGTWGALYVARWQRRHSYALVGSAGPGLRARGVSSMSWTTTKSAIEAAPIVPKLTPAQTATVNGASFVAGAPSVSVATTVSWTPPAVGSPLFYQLGVRELYVLPNGRTAARGVAMVSTPHTSFTYPAGVLDPARTYVFAITACASTSSDPTHGANLANAPFKSTIELACATLSSGVFGNGLVLEDPRLVQTGQQLPLGLAKNTTALFWTEHVDPFEYPPVSTGSGRIWTANLDGSNAHVIVTGADGPYYVAADDAAVYWTERANGADSSVQRYDLATSQVTTLVVQEGIEAITLCPNGDVAFSGWQGTQILRGGGGPPELLSFENAADLACDSTNVYIAAYAGRVLQVPLAGGPELELANGQPDPWGIEVDATHVYWSNAAWTGTASINRVPIGGGVTTELVTGSMELRTFAIDGGYAYFGTHTALKRVSLAGGPIELVAVAECTDGQLVAFGGNVAWHDLCSNTTNLFAP